MKLSYRNTGVLKRPSMIHTYSDKRLMYVDKDIIKEYEKKKRENDENEKEMKNDSSIVKSKQ